MDKSMRNFREESRRPRSLFGACFGRFAPLLRHGSLSAVILLSVGCAGRNPSAGSNTTIMSTATSLPENMKLRLPPAVFDAREWPTKLGEAVARSNDKARIDGLPDHLNPQIIDSAKAESFLRALSQRPADELRPFAGRI